MKLSIKYSIKIAIALLFILRFTLQVGMNKKLKNQGNNKYINRMNSRRFISDKNRIQFGEFKNPSSNKELNFQASLITRTIDLAHKNNITIQLTWNNTEIPSLHLILRRTNGKFIKNNEKSEKIISVKKLQTEEISSETVRLKKIKKGVFSLYMKLERPKNSIENANVQMIIKQNNTELSSFRLDHFSPNYWYLGIFDYDLSKFIATRGVRIDLKEIDKEVTKYMALKKQKEEQEIKKRPIGKVNENKTEKKRSHSKSEKKNCPNRKKIIMKWLKNLLGKMLSKGNKMKQLVNEGFEPETNFLQRNEKYFAPNKVVPKKVKRLLVIFPMRKIIILRGEKLINKIRSLPVWKKRLFKRMLRRIIMGTIRTKKIRKMKKNLIVKIKNFLNKIQ